MTHLLIVEDDISPHILLPVGRISQQTDEHFRLKGSSSVTDLFLATPIEVSVGNALCHNP